MRKWIRKWLGVEALEDRVKLHAENRAWERGQAERDREYVFGCLKQLGFQNKFIPGEPAKPARYEIVRDTSV